MSDVVDKAKGLLKARLYAYPESLVRDLVSEIEKLRSQKGELHQQYRLKTVDGYYRDVPPADVSFYLKRPHPNLITRWVSNWEDVE
ncbi:hypothetical protein [Mycobacteroides chelonae]|uniref:hypothetical protein n=1 Tax=Mycobacteroides chelonae TaxID=1774 RepID=UPI0005C6D6D4|nr:hypothetical protein [Mycobacteroides chelonae]OHT67795.1 hypothetical protein BKG66_24530 [Mycobacteroides chelonae]OHT69438.1 hypothetical protein BKG67_23065 [Mycobacteroides chelonae]